MNIVDFYQKQINIHPNVISLINKGQNEISGQFKKIEEMAEYHQSRIIEYMKQCQISTRHFQPSTGYGYGDESRDRLDNLFALVFGSQDALVRPQWVSGTHVLSDAIFSLLRPGDALVSITGKPYDTLEDTIVSLKKEWGISYDQVNLKADNEFDIQQILNVISKKILK